jgi:glycosyltransferase involved in cell wall biosynthesis
MNSSSRGARLRINLHIYPATCTHDARLLKETQSLAEHGFFDLVVICGLWAPGLEEHETLGHAREIWRFRAESPDWLPGFPGKVWGRTAWLLAIFRRFRREGVVCVNAHAWSILPLAALFKACCGARIVYDAHELETETSASPAQRKLAKFVESALMGRVDALIVASESIRRWYYARFRHPPLQLVRVVRNIPHNRRSPPPPQKTLIFREKFDIRPDEILFIYQGVLGSDRNIEMLLRIFSRAAADRHIVLMGFGEMEARIQALASRCRNIHLHPAVPPDEVVAYAAGADVGIHIIDNSCLNHYYCLPNKVFEYMIAGLPQVVSDFPEIALVVGFHDCGWTVPVSEAGILALVNSITPAQIAQKGANAVRARSLYSWEQEEVQMFWIYEALFGASTSTRPGTW